MKRLLAIAVFYCSTFLSLSTPGFAQDSMASLTADRITYTSGYRVLRATGNVEISFGTTRLEATTLTYDEQNNWITAEGPLRLTDAENNITFLADYAEMSDDMQKAVLVSARMVLNQQMQLSAVEINRRDGRYNQLIKAAASSCTVTLAKPTPFWQVRARRIIHDEDRKRLFFEHAQLRLGPVPIAYMPRLRVPDPSVKRANGFLVPGVGNSSTLGPSINAPYFLTLGDYADVTLTPYVYSSGTATVAYAFRKRFRNGELNLTGAVTNDTRNAQSLRAYLFADSNLRFRNGLHADVQLEFTSDNSYLSDHGISGDTRLESFIKLNRATQRSNFHADILGFNSLNDPVSNEQEPFLIGDAGYRRIWFPAMLGGQAGISARTYGVYRRSATDILGRDGVRVSTVADWQREWIAGNGLVFSTTAEVHADAYYISQDSTYTQPLYRVTPFAAADLRFPLSRQTARATETLEPRVQIVWSPGSGTSVPDEDSQLVEFEYNNLFSLNRFAGIDQYERGLRANVGVTYTRKSTKGLMINAVAGKVIRASDLGQFAAASGLSGTSSSFVLGGQITLPSKFRMVQRMVFSDSLQVSKNETRFAYDNERFDVGGSYLWLVKDAAANTVSDRSEWLMDTGVNLGRNWRTEASWRYDLATSSPSDAGVALTYRNECIKIDLSLSRRFVSSSNVSASTNLGFQVTLEGFGSRADSSAYNRKCSDF